MMSDYFNLNPRNVHAYVIGEHGDSEFVPWSQSSVSVMPLNEMKENYPDLDENMATIEEKVRNSAYEIINDKGATYYAIGMVLFTMIMGNAFAAITVMTVGIGAPFVLAYGANPVVIGMLALTCGYCGTLLTPMAANFNILPVAILNMKDRWGAIKNQVLVAIIMLVFQICYMIVLK